MNIIGKTPTTRNRHKSPACLLICFVFMLLLMVLLMVLLTPQVAEAEQEDGGNGYSKVSTVDPVGKTEGYSAVMYDNTNDLPAPDANVIEQTSEGFIWIGSYSGLIRYDGNRFDRVGYQEGVHSVISLFVDHKERIWIGTNDSGLAMMEKSKFRFWDEEDGMRSVKVCDISEDEEGVIYVGTTEGIYAVDQNMELKPVDHPRAVNAYSEVMFPNGDGNVYCLTKEEEILALRGGEVKACYKHDKESAAHPFSSISMGDDGSGEGVIGTEDSILYVGDLTSSEKLTVVDVSPLYSVFDVDVVNNQIWLCARNGIGVLDDKGLHVLDNLPMNNSINQMMVDYEGNLWFTSSRQGVMKVVPNQFSNINTKLGLDPGVVNTTCVSGKKLFIGTDTGLMVAGKKGLLSSVPVTSVRTASGRELEGTDLLDLMDGVRIRSITKDSQGRLWFATWYNLGLLRYDHGKVTAFSEHDGLASNFTRGVSETEDGRILVASAGGVSVIEGDSVIKNYGVEEGVTNNEALTVCSAPNGDILMGSNGGGIYIISDKGVRTISRKDGVGSDVVMRIQYDAKRDLFWILTGSSLAYMTTDYKVTLVKEFPFASNFELFENNRDEMWILGGYGVCVVPTQELLDNGEIVFTQFGVANGLPGTPVSNSYSSLTDNGDLYIATYSGVAKVNINAPAEDVSNIKIAIPYITADGKDIYPDKKGNFTIPAGTQRVTINDFVFAYTLTDPWVVCCLHDFDQKPTISKVSEMGPLVYTNLPGGEYEFTMELSDPSRQSEKSMSVKVVKEKATHEKAWPYFVGMAGLLVLIILVGGVYVRRRIAKLEEKHREEKELAQVNNELQMAKRIQTSALPHKFPPFPDRTEFELYASMDPAKEVGGDFYDFFLIDEDHLCLVIADVSGKGIPAALYMMNAKTALKNHASTNQSAAEILVNSNNALYDDDVTKMFVTVWLGILELSTGMLTTACAGHECPALRRAGGTYELWKEKHGFVLGGLPGMKYTDYTIQLHPGDQIFVYTDGVPEATDAHDEMFGIDRMLQTLNQDPQATPKQQLRNVRAAVDEFVQEEEQFDDLTMLCLTYWGKED